MVVWACKYKKTCLWANLLIGKGVLEDSSSFNRVLNKFGKILKIASKSYSQLIVFIQIMVNHNGVLILNTYHPTGSKNPWE